MGIILRAERGKPHLPVESRLMRRIESRGLRHIARFPPEQIRFPVGAVDAAFNNDFWSRFGHFAKQPVVVHQKELGEI